MTNGKKRDLEELYADVGCLILLSFALGAVLGAVGSLLVAWLAGR